MLNLTVSPRKELASIGVGAVDNEEEEEVEHDDATKRSDSGSTIQRHSSVSAENNARRTENEKTLLSNIYRNI